MAEKISIHVAGPHDLCAIMRIFCAARASLGFLPALHTHEETKDFLAQVIATQTVLVAGDDVGGIQAMSAIADGWLNHLYVDPVHHGRGIGSALLACVKAQCADGFSLWCFADNTRARRFYERHGCVPVEFTDGHGNEEHLPDVRYAWNPVSTILSAPPASTAR